MDDEVFNCLGLIELHVCVKQVQGINVTSSTGVGHPTLDIPGDMLVTFE